MYNMNMLGEDEENEGWRGFLEMFSFLPFLAKFILKTLKKRENIAAALFVVVVVHLFVSWGTEYDWLTYTLISNIQ